MYLIYLKTYGFRQTNNSYLSVCYFDLDLENPIYCKIYGMIQKTLSKSPLPLLFSRPLKGRRRIREEKEGLDNAATL